MVLFPGLEGFLIRKGASFAVSVFEVLVCDFSFMGS
jgi:hypothetical protein